MSQVVDLFMQSRMAYALLMGFTLAPAFFGGVALMMTVQQRSLPVVDSFVIHEAVFDHDGNIVLAGAFDKNYPDWMCKFQRLKWFMPDARLDGTVLKLRIDAEYSDKRPTPEDNNRFAGLNEFYGWKVKISDYPELNSFSGYAEHTCLMLWPARTALPMITIPEGVDRQPGVPVDVTALGR